MSSDETEYGALIIIIVAILFLVYGIWSIYTTWQLFKKAGQPGWAALIPIYQNYIFGVIAGLPIWLIGAWIALAIANNFYEFLGLLYFAVSVYVLYKFIPKYTASTSFWLAYIFIPMISVFMVKNVAYIGTDAPAQQSTSEPGPTAPADPSLQSPVQQNTVGFAPKPASEQQFAATKTPATEAAEPASTTNNNTQQ